MGRRFRRILVEREILRQLPVRKGFRFQRGYSVARAIGGVGLIVGSSFVCAENLPVSASVAKPSSVLSTTWISTFSRVGEVAWRVALSRLKWKDGLKS